MIKAMTNWIVGFIFCVMLMAGDGVSHPLAGLSKILDGVNSEKVMECLPIQSIGEYEILCRIVEAEATDGTAEQKENVTSCVLNRVNSHEFPNTIEAVVFEKGQFTPISDGRYYKVVITDSTRKAVNKILWRGPQHDCLFFCTSCNSYYNGWFSTLKESFYDGMHHYFKGDKK